VRNVVGRFSLDQLLSDTASINEQIKNVIDRHTELGFRLRAGVAP
jgi:regulator of protease activity HflC (stomatin/prohibitin superfamily)